MRCPVCYSNAIFDTIRTKEMMFGTRDSFNYGECAQCKCLYILNPPSDFAKYYPQDSYYSFSGSHQWLENQKDTLRRIRFQHVFQRKRSILGFILSLNYSFTPFLTIFGNLHVKHSASILDVGCGNGDLLRTLYMFGYKNLQGADPFIKETFNPAENIFIRKQEITEINETFDIIMLHHVLEHLPEQHKTFESLTRLLNPKGMIIIRTPCCSSYSFRKYKENWVQLDPPRHVVVHSTTSFKALADKHGLVLEKMFWDSEDFQFLGSELYVKDIPLRELPAHIDKKQRKQFRTLAKQLNADGDGDQFCAILKKR